MASSLFKLNSRDFVKGLVVAVLIAVLQLVLTLLQNKGLDLAKDDLLSILDIAVKGGAAYLVKNLLSTEDGKVFGKI